MPETILQPSKKIIYDNMEFPKYGKRKNHLLLRGQLDNERSSFVSHWKDLADFIKPRRIRLNTSDVNRGDKRNQNIIDSTGTFSYQVLRAGMMSGVTSPARQWARLTTPDPDMAEYAPVKEWLYTVEQRMFTAYNRSNLYNSLPTIYGDMGLFATGCMFIEEDFDDVLRTYTYPVGSYWIANNHKLQVDTFMRDFRMTIRQLIQKFGKNIDGKPNWGVFSEYVKNAYYNGNYESWVDVSHIIQPNEQYDPKSMRPENKKFESCYFETGKASGGKHSYMDDNQDVYLRESGYDRFPVLAPRWEVTGEDVYGTDCPFMTALGDIKQLQTGEKRILQGIEKNLKPPLVGSSRLKTTRVSSLPGDVSFDDTPQSQNGLRALYQIDPRINEMEMKQEQVRSRIRKHSYEELFLMLANSTRRQITAREIEERHEEKLLALGPMLEQLNQDLLDPLIDYTYDILDRQGQIPPPPPELDGVDLKIEYISVMAQAQKLVNIGGIERFAGFASQLVAADPAAADKIDTDQMIDVYADMTSVPPGIVRSDETVAKIRADKAKAAQAQQAPAAMRDVTSSVKNLSESDMGGGQNALNEMIQLAQAGQVT